LLARTGYKPHTSGIAMNVACSDRALDPLDRRVERIVREGARCVEVRGSTSDWRSTGWRTARSPRR
jgi:hypothetical protein